MTIDIKNSLIRGIGLIVCFFVFLSIPYSMVEANTVRFQNAGGGNRFDGLDSISTGAGVCSAEFCGVSGGVFECSDLGSGEAICRKEYLTFRGNELVYGNCTNNPESTPRYVCTRITNIPNEYVQTNASQEIPQSVIDTALGQTSEEQSQELDYQPGYTITVNNEEYQGECATFTQNASTSISCRAEGVEGVLTSCYEQTPRGENTVVCRNSFVADSVGSTVGELSSAEPFSSETQNPEDFETPLPQSEEKAVAYESFTNFPGIGRITNMCQLMEALWFLGFIVLFIGVIGSILYGGFLYTSAGVNAAQVNEAKGLIQNAFIGLGLGLSIFVILQTIDPNLLGGNCEVPVIGQMGESQSE